MNSSKKILLITGASCGGAERMTLLYGKILENAGYNISLMVDKNSNVFSFPLMPFIPTNWPLILNNCRARWIPLKIWLGINKIKPNIIFTSLGDLNNILLTLKAIGIIKAQTIIRCNNMPSLFSVKENHLAKLMYKKADRIIAQTDEMRYEIIRTYQVQAEKVVTINNPIDKTIIASKLIEPFELDHSYINYVAVGRIHHQKDYCTLIKAFAIVLEKQKQSRLYIVGDYKNDVEKKAIDELIESLGLSAHIFIEGFQSNPYKYIKECDVFCLSSVIEGLPNVLLEALYLGRPVAVTQSIPFIQQVVQDGINGYTCSIHDYKKFADCMLNARSIKGLPKNADVTHSEEKIVELFASINND